MRYIRQHTDIPVPAVYCDFEDDEAYYLITEYIQGVAMADLEEAQKATVRAELQHHLNTLKALVSTRVGGPTGITIPPYRAMQLTNKDEWRLRDSISNDFVFCHNDLSQYNIIVDPVTLKINAIIDWEYAGFYPSFFEWPFYHRPGPSAALEGEEDDSPKLIDFLISQVGVA